MNRTEDDLRAVYTDQPGVEDVERRVIAWCSTLGTTTSTRRRRPMATWAAAGASAAAVAALAAGTALVVPHLGAHDSQRSPASGAPPTSAASTPVSPPPAPPAKVTITPQVAVRTLLSLLPRHGSTTRLTGGSTLGEVGGTFVYDDGHGPAEVSVGVSYPFRYQGKLQRRPAGSLCSSQGVQQDHSPCTTLPDGSQVSVYQGDANIPGGAKDREVSLLRPDGVEVDVTEWNSPIEKGGQQTRAVPPFTIAELTTIVRSKKWQATVDRATAQHDASLFTPQRS